MDYSKKKVIFITGSLCDGGAEKVMSILASGCAEQGANTTLVVLREKKMVYSLSPHVNLVQIKVGKSKFKLIRRIIKLHKVLKYSEADVVIPFLPIISLYTLIANRGVRKRIIMSERGDPNVKYFNNKLSVKDRVGSFLMRDCGLFGKSYKMVFQTEDAKNFYSKSIQDKSTIIPNPLDISNLPEMFYGERKKKIVAVGRLSNEKNFSLLIKTFNEFHKKFPDYILYIYGEGKQREYLEQYINNLSLTDFVRMPGFISNVQSKIVDASMYISTSNHEGISNSLLEALGMGVPTIATDCPVGGSRMFVKTNETGILIPTNNSERLLEAMEKIVENKNYADQISKGALKIRNELSANEICRKWLDLV
ncbi:MAG: glycosyltransferase [Anaerostipes sp.]|jgi:GalNAc-alpha-(1->4)-GalNAc-alpha-(1->3)-diNAcBac-PP-undecaprenol alpha-1,4-N-acetyl-D-galactosaminyltransferase|nr:glycosyltransferase [Anaerostipes sp.]